MCEGVGVGAGFDEVAAEGETVDDRGTEPRVSESFCSSGECFVGGDRDAVAMAGNASHYVVHSWEVQEQRIDVDGDCAAVLQRIDLQANVIGEGRNGLFVISDIWRLHTQAWRIWRRHSTTLSAGQMPGGS